MSGAATQTPKQIEAWNVIQNRREFTVDTVRDLGVSPEAAAKYIASWIALGLVEQHRLDGTRRVYRPTANRDETRLPGEETPTEEGNMWRGMRRNRVFTATDVACWSNAGGIEVSIERARSYCQKLVAHGVLRMTSRRSSRRSGQVYQMVDDVGPLPPRMRRVTALYDPNSRTYRHQDEGIDT